MCHLDAEMTRQGIEALEPSGLDVVILENVGNLVCSAEFDTGAHKNVMILSIPEGDDKPLKYPLMFSSVAIVLVNKVDMDLFKERLAKLNPEIQVVPISAKNGEGMEPWYEWLKEQVKKL